jgi:hypothetical protein
MNHYFFILYVFLQYEIKGVGILHDTRLDAAAAGTLIS